MPDGEHVAGVCAVWVPAGGCARVGPIKHRADKRQSPGLRP